MSADVIKRDPCISADVRSLVQGDRFTLWDHTDDGLRRMRREFTRQAEDAADDGQPERATNARNRAEWIKQHQLVRFCLRMRYGAKDYGTDINDQYARLGVAPSYRLALLIDRTACSLGKRHILRYAEAAAS